MGGQEWFVFLSFSSPSPDVFLSFPILLFHFINPLFSPPPPFPFLLSFFLGGIFEIGWAFSIREKYCWFWVYGDGAYDGKIFFFLFCFVFVFVGAIGLFSLLSLFLCFSFPFYFSPFLISFFFFLGYDTRGARNDGGYG